MALPTYAINFGSAAWSLQETHYDRRHVFLVHRILAQHKSAGAKVHTLPIGFVGCLAAVLCLDTYKCIRCLRVCVSVYIINEWLTCVAQSWQQDDEATRVPENQSECLPHFEFEIPCGSRCQAVARWWCIKVALKSYALKANGGRNWTELSIKLGSRLLLK